MSLTSLPIPEETARVARAVFPRGNVLMQLRETLGTIYTDEAFADLFPSHGQPALAPWRLALVTLFQFIEGLTDRQTADAVRDRLAWKYALSLEICDPGFDHTVLSEFRLRLVEGPLSCGGSGLVLWRGSRRQAGTERPGRGLRAGPQTIACVVASPRGDRLVPEGHAGSQVAECRATWPPVTLLRAQRKSLWRRLSGCVARNKLIC
jgi:hypothetical protein